MKRVMFFLVFTLILLVMVTGCDLLDEITIEGSGDIVTQTEDFDDFDNVDLSHSFKASINQGESYSVVIRVDDNLLDELRVTKQGSTLKIDLNRNIFTRNATLEVDITMPDLAGLNLSGASEADINGFSSNDRFRAELSGSSDVSGNIEAGDVTLDLSGSSTMNISGSGADLEIDASGSSDVDLSDFPVEDANVNVSGSSNATVNVNGTLDVDASGASDVYYVGSPTLGNVDTSGSSSVEAR